MAAARLSHLGDGPHDDDDVYIYATSSLPSLATSSSSATQHDIYAYIIYIKQPHAYPSMKLQQPEPHSPIQPSTLINPYSYYGIDSSLQYRYEYWYRADTPHYWLAVFSISNCTEVIVRLLTPAFPAILLVRMYSSV